MKIAILNKMKHLLKHLYMIIIKTDITSKIIVSYLTPSWRRILDEYWSTELYYTWMFPIFHVESEYVISKMIHWAKIKGRQV